jgi:hypothetical protein
VVVAGIYVESVMGCAQASSDAPPPYAYCEKVDVGAYVSVVANV